MKEIQESDFKHDSAVEQKRKEPFLLKLKTELDELEIESQKGAYYLIKVIIEKHKPKYSKGFDLKFEDINSSNIKKTLLTLIKHFHPDK